MGSVITTSTSETVLGSHPKSYAWADE